MQKFTRFVRHDAEKFEVGTFSLSSEGFEGNEKIQRYVMYLEDLPLKEGETADFFGPPGVNRSIKILSIADIEIEGEKFKKIILEYQATELGQPMVLF